ncbi:hypothetical protein [Prescottella subtropica]|uniref:hypothetical protein n=1 Tax=Prescottella subtropica TaxID=2545757 RepID=UPI0010F7FCF6|nr:hypothetical protein [Prescottella subtropica]
MNYKKIGFGAAALASATTLAFAGTAQAATAVEGTPTKDYQLCGTVYEGAAGDWVANTPVPLSKTGVGGVDVTGVLTGNTPWTDTVTTAPDGTFCLDGTLSMALDVQFGGAYVTLSVKPATLPAGKSVTSSNPWADGGSSQINSSVFNAHQHPTKNSAWGFYFTVN